MPEVSIYLTPNWWVPKPFSRQCFATASSDFNSPLTKFLSHFWVWQSPVQPRRSQVLVGKWGNLWQHIPVVTEIQWRRKGFKCCLAEPESFCFKVSLLSLPGALEPSVPSVWSWFWPSSNLSLQFCSAWTGPHVLRFPCSCHWRVSSPFRAHIRFVSGFYVKILGLRGSLTESLQRKMEAFFLGAEFNWIFGLSLSIMVLTVLSAALGFFTKMQPIKERFTTSNHSTNTIAAFSDSQSASTGWSCPAWAGEQSSHCFLCKGRGTGQQHLHGKVDPWAWIVPGKQELWISASSQHPQGAAPAPGRVWSLPTGLSSPDNDPSLLGHCWARV